MKVRVALSEPAPRTPIIEASFVHGLFVSLESEVIQGQIHKVDSAGGIENAGFSLTFSMMPGQGLVAGEVALSPEAKTRVRNAVAQFVTSVLAEVQLQGTIPSGSAEVEFQSVPAPT